MISFEKISFEKVKKLIIIISELKEKSSEFIKSKYLKFHDNFEDIEIFLISAGLMYEINGRLELSEDLLKLINIKMSDEELKLLLIKKILKKENRDFEIAHRYITNYYYRNTLIEYKPNMEARIIESGVRNLLIELDLINYDKINEVYKINQNRQQLLIDQYYSIKMNPKEFEDELNKLKEIGLAAEVAIIHFEKKRLIKRPELIELIDHIALKDVTAGYDILSWEDEYTNNDKVPRYIEVKAISRTENSFFWTRNEIETARRYGSKYFLYLLPILGKADFSLNELLIIPNPIKNVFDNSLKWEKHVDKYKIIKKIN